MINSIVIFLNSIITISYIVHIKCTASLLGLSSSGSGRVPGLSFDYDTKDKRLTRVFGTGIHYALDVLEITAGGGKWSFSKSHLEFEISNTRWIQLLTDIKISFFHNDKSLIQLYVPEDDNLYYYLTMPLINLMVHDIILDKSLNNNILINLCMSEKINYFNEFIINNFNNNIEINETLLNYFKI